MTLRGDWSRVLVDQVLISLGCSLAVFALAGAQQAASMAIGAFLTTFNFALLAWAWTRIFEKKSIALAGTIIVIKYAIFVGFLIWILQQRWIQGLWLMAGIITFVPTSLLLSWRARDSFGKGT